MAGILKFALGLDIGNLGENAEKAHKFIERLASSSKGTGIGDVFEKLSTSITAVKTSVAAIGTGGGGGFLGLASAAGTALVAVQAIEASFHVVYEVVERVVDKLIEAAHEGATLYYLSKRTNIGIGQLYGLEEGSKAVGLNAEAPIGMTLRLQRALSGVSEEGERTDNTFAALGLNMRQLRALSPDQQFLKVAEALAKVNAAQRSGYASNLFGRFNYGDILQIVGQLDTFKEEMEKADPGGKLFNATAKSFAEATGSWKALEADITVFFASIAKYLVDPFKDVIDALRGFPWQAIGEQIGQALRPITTSLRLAANLQQFMQHPVDFGRKKGAELGREMGEGHGIMDQLGRGLNWFMGIPNAGKGPNANHPNSFAPQPYTPSHVNAFEKMGFVFNNGADTAVDYAKRTAIATEKIATLAERRSSTHLGSDREEVNAP